MQQFISILIMIIYIQLNTRVVNCTLRIISKLNIYMNFAFKNTIRHYKHLKKYTLNDNLKKGKHMKYIKSIDYILKHLNCFSFLIIQFFSSLYRSKRKPWLLSLASCIYFEKQMVLKTTFTTMMSCRLNRTIKLINLCYFITSKLL